MARAGGEKNSVGTSLSKDGSRMAEWGDHPWDLRAGVQASWVLRTSRQGCRLTLHSRPPGRGKGWPGTQDLWAGVQAGLVLGSSGQGCRLAWMEFCWLPKASPCMHSSFLQVICLIFNHLTVAWSLCSPVLIFLSLPTFIVQLPSLVSHPPNPHSND